MRLLPIAAFALIFFSLAPTVLAAEVTTPTPTTPSVTTPTPTGQITTLINPLNIGNCNSANGECLSTFLNKILDFVILIGGIIVMLMLVLVGYKFVVAQGNDSKLTEAKQMLLWTIIGALILIGAKAIALGITETVKALSVP